MPVYSLAYRPQKISEFDSPAVAKFLKRVLMSKTLPHAFLFAGPKGTGKTSAARVLAKAVNCTKLEGIEPCGRCAACVGIANGSFLDLMEIDGASNRGIDEIRDLREKIKLTPTMGKYKVYIIDEVHMLTTAAFNALLKTLEEPPPHAIFVLCTTAPEKLPETIISRCFRLNFKKATQEEILDSLKRVAQGEKIKVPREVLKLIANESDGSFRDAHKILEQVVMEGEPYTVEKTRKLLEVVETKRVREFIVLVCQKKVKEAIFWLDDFVQRGGNLKILTTQVLGGLRELLLAKIGVENQLPITNYQLPIEDIKFLIELFSTAASQLKYAVIPQLPLEMAIVEWGGGEQETGKNAKSVKGKIGEDNAPLKDAVKANPPVDIRARWKEIIAGVKPHNHSVAALLCSCRPKSFDGQLLTIEAFYKFHQEKLSGIKVRELLERALKEILGLPVKVNCVLGARKEREEKLIKKAREIFGVE